MLFPCPSFRLAGKKKEFGTARRESHAARRAWGLNQREIAKLDKEDLKALEAEISNFKNKLQDANEQARQLDDERAELEARNVALLEDKKAAAVKASALGLELCEKEDELKALNDGFKALNDRLVETNDKYLDIVAERDERVAVCLV